MSIDRITVAVAGLLIMASAGAHFATQAEFWLYVPPFVGFMLFQATFTRFCPLPFILKLMGVRPGAVFT